MYLPDMYKVLVSILSTTKIKKGCQMAQWVRVLTRQAWQPEFGPIAHIKVKGEK